MGKTIVEKILSRAGGCEDGSAGDIVDARISFLVTNDAVGELTRNAFEALKTEPWDRNRIAVVLDHFTPAATENAARVHRLLRDFSRTHGLRLFDHEGVCHRLMLENFVSPGDVVIGTDSHTCSYGALGAFATGVGSTDGAVAMASGRIWLRIPETVRVELHDMLPAHVHPKDIILWLIGHLGADGAVYKALQFSGDGAASISNAGRITMCNMAVEAGAKTGIFEPDAVTESYYGRRPAPGSWFTSDADASYAGSITVDLHTLVPQVSCPWSVDNVVPVDEVLGTRIDQAFIGACTNGSLEDMRSAASLLDGEKISPHVRLLIAPSSKAVYQQALTEGLMEIFIKSGATLCNPGCSACFGGQGMLWEGEVCIGTHNRNFRGRMGHRDSRVYLASPETAAKSALAGYIADPRQG